MIIAMRNKRKKYGCPGMGRKIRFIFDNFTNAKYSNDIKFLSYPFLVVFVYCFYFNFCNYLACKLGKYEYFSGTYLSFIDGAPIFEFIIYSFLNQIILASMVAFLLISIYTTFRIVYNILINIVTIFYYSIIFAICLIFLFVHFYLANMFLCFIGVCTVFFSGEKSRFSLLPQPDNPYRISGIDIDIFFVICAQILSFYLATPIIMIIREHAPPYSKKYIETYKRLSREIEEATMND